MPKDDHLICARIGMPLKAFAELALIVEFSIKNDEKLFQIKPVNPPPPLVVAELPEIVLLRMITWVVWKV